MKSDAWEAGHRVPFIVRWPGRTPSGEVSSEPIILTDLMRTFATLVGHSLPEDSAEDSFDILDALQGKKAQRPVHDQLIHHSGNGVFAIRQGDWKLILGKGSGGFTRYKAPADAPAGQLYHLGDDPAEQINLYSEKPEIVEKLTQLLKLTRSSNSSYRLTATARQ
jgi:arylsulfatase A-like enzyme